jgi:hypothetical protein
VRKEFEGLYMCVFLCACMSVCVCLMCKEEVLKSRNCWWSGSSGRVSASKHGVLSLNHGTAKMKTKSTQ